MADIDQAVQLYDSGPSLRGIGVQLGWDHHNGIYRHLKRRGVEFRGPSDWKYQEVEGPPRYASLF